MSTETENGSALRPWVMLALGVLAQASGTVLVSTPAFLIPLLHTERGMPLSTAGLLAATPTVGMVLTLVAWGALADRIGERWVIAGGVALTAVAAAGAALASSSYLALGAFLLLGGIGAASTGAASGRLVIGWFPRRRRGLAMGIRQMAQPLGVALAAVTIPVIAATGGIAPALWFSVVLSGVVAIVSALVLRDPPRPARGPAAPALVNPYRGSSALWRIHLVSLLLVVPQFTLATFGLVWLITEQHLDAGIAGVVIGLSQLVGATGRIGVGVLSDRVGSRLRPLRWVALAAVAVMLLLALLDQVNWPLAIAVLVIATTVSVADNGLAFTAVAEIAGPGWSGRALGTQNTGQYLAASAVGPLAGALIAVVGYPLTFVGAAICALVAVPLVPRVPEHEHEPGR